MSRRPNASIVASPVLVGAVTVLVACISVLLAVQANSGLPFVPTYNLSAELPGGANLVVGNEVRMGGFRVGLIEKIRPAVDPDGEQRAIAVVDMKLDKKIEPLDQSTRLIVRPRSALGLKYIQLTPGKSGESFERGDTIPLANSTKPVELDEFFGTFDSEFRQNQRKVLEGYGTALSGRGTSINEAIRDLVPFVTHLQPVMTTLSARSTRLDNFFRQAGRTSAQIAPVARTYAQLFVNMGTTFEALSRNPDRLQGTIERAAPTLESGIRSFPVQRPFLRDSRILANRLEPVAVEMQQSLPAATRAFRVGSPVLDKAPVLYRNTRRVFASLDDLAENPNTLLALKDLHRTLDVTTPLVEYVAPYQTVCNYWVYYWTAISEHVSENAGPGTIQRTNLKSDNRTQDNRLSTSDGDRPVDVPSNEDPQEASTPLGALQALHRGAYEPAVDSQGNADCQVGQRGYLDGPLVSGNRYAPSTDADQGGGSHVVLDSDIPGLAGGTYKSRQLGIDNLRDVP